MATTFNAQHLGHGGKTSVTAEQKEQMEQGKIAHNFRFTEVEAAEKPAKTPSTSTTGKPGAKTPAELPATGTPATE